LCRLCTYYIYIYFPKSVLENSYIHSSHIKYTQDNMATQKLSTDTAIYALLNNVLLSMERRNFVGGLFCDLQKAFDCVNHEILLEKMKLYGISGTVNKLMESYLENRYQRVSANNIKPRKLYSTWPVQEFVQ